MPRLAALLLLALAAPVAQAEVYKWVDEQGRTHYSNAPPPAAAGKSQAVEERMSVMGMDPVVRAWAERKFAMEAQAEERDWQLRQRALAAQQAATAVPARQKSSPPAYPAYRTYYPVAYSPYSYGGKVFTAVVPRPTPQHSRSHSHAPR